MQPARQRLVNEAQSLGVFSTRRGYAGQLIKGLVLHIAVPCRLIKGVIGLFRISQSFQRKPEIIVRLAVVGIGVFPCGGFYRRAEIFNAIVKKPAVIQVFTVAVVYAYVGWVTFQSFKIIGLGRACGVAVLLQMGGRKEELFICGQLLRLGDSLGR